MSLAYLNPANEWGEIDLSSLACDAAIELDNLILGKNSNTRAVRCLADLVLESLSVKPKSPMDAALLNPATVAVMHRAIDDSMTFSNPLTTVNQVIKEAGKIHKRFKSVSDNPDMCRQQDPNGLVEMRTFCLALSKHASAYDRSIDEWELRNPFGR